jgi:hypothetical protein
MKKMEKYIDDNNFEKVELQIRVKKWKKGSNMKDITEWEILRPM